MEFTDEQIAEILEIAFPELENINHIDPRIKYLPGSKRGRKFSRMTHLLAKARRHPETKWGGILRNISDFADYDRFAKWGEPAWIRAQRALETAYTANQLVRAPNGFIPFSYNHSILDNIFVMCSNSISL